MRSGMRSSADQPSAERATRASQFSSQSDDESVSLKRSASDSTPAALTANSKALVPARRESKSMVIESASIGPVAAREPTDDRRRRLPAIDADVDRVPIVDDADGRLLGRARPLHWELLREGVDRRRGAPRRIVELAVELRRLGDANRAQMRRRGVGRQRRDKSYDGERSHRRFREKTS